MRKMSQYPTFSVYGVFVVAAVVLQKHHNPKVHGYVLHVQGMTSGTEFVPFEPSSKVPIKEKAKW